MEYIPPKNTEVIFRFDSSGYTPPDFSSAVFKFSPELAKSALKAVINGVEVYQQPRDYLKGCSTNVVGYSSGSLQIFKSGCIYGGIRDLPTLLRVINLRDLPAYIKIGYAEHIDLDLLLKGWKREALGNITNITKGWAVERTVGLDVFLKGWESELIGNISNIIKGWVAAHPSDLEFLLKGWKREAVSNISNAIKSWEKEAVSNISNAIKSWITEQPSDLEFLLKGWKIEAIVNISNAIKSWVSEQQVDLSWYIKSTINENSDLITHLKVFQHQYVYFAEMIKGWRTGVTKDLFNTIKAWHSDALNISEYIKSTINESSGLITHLKVFQHTNRNINLMLHGWQEADLQYIVQSLHIGDLNFILRAVYLNDLNAFLYAIQPVDIEAKLMGWAIQDLSVYIAKGGYGGDIPVNIYGIPAVNLPIYLAGKLGIQTTRDLNGTMTNLVEENLSAYLNIISYSDLNVYLLSSRLTSDLRFEIYPKIVFVRHNISVSFLEHRDLAASINHTCISSSFRELAVSMVAQHKYDLPCRIYGGDGSNIGNLKVLINSYEYTAQNTIPVKFINLNPSTRATIGYKKSAIYSINTINVYNIATLMKGYTDLTYGVTGNMLHEDLGVVIHPYSNKHYDTSATHKFVTLKLKNNVEDFRKYVELTFDSYVNQYYYFSGNQRAYKAFRDDHWVVRVEGRQLLPVGSGYEKIKVNRKYIFNLKHYKTIDAAVTDMIDRVTQLKNSDLTASITATGGIFEDLNVQVMPNDINGIASRIKYYTNRTLGGVILVIRPQDADLFAYIVPTGLYGRSNLAGEVTGVDYINPTDGTVDFNFEGSGDTQPPSDQIGFTFIFGED